MSEDSLGSDGTADAKVERRLKEAITAFSTSSPPATNLDPRVVASSFQYTTPSSSVIVPPPAIQGPTPLSFSSPQLPQVMSLLNPEKSRTFILQERRARCWNLNWIRIQGGYYSFCNTAKT